jgi:hypothetical protein
VGVLYSIILAWRNITAEEEPHVYLDGQELPLNFDLAIEYLGFEGGDVVDIDIRFTPWPEPYATTMVEC